MIKKIVIIFSLIISPSFITVTFGAAMGMGGMGMGPPLPCGGPFPPCPVPLDNGVWLLLIAGLAYGGKKIYNSLKKDPA
jgi:hypothetical protein